MRIPSASPPVSVTQIVLDQQESNWLSSKYSRYSSGTATSPCSASPLRQDRKSFLNPPQSVQCNTCLLHVGNSVQAYPSHLQVKLKKKLGPIKICQVTVNRAAELQNSCQACSSFAIPGLRLARFSLRMLHSYILNLSSSLAVLFATHFGIHCASIHDSLN